MKKAITLTALVISVTINLWLWHKKNTLSLELASEQAHTLQIEQSLSDEYAHEKAIASAQAIANAKINKQTHKEINECINNFFIFFLFYLDVSTYVPLYVAATALPKSWITGAMHVRSFHQ